MITHPLRIAAGATFLALAAAPALAAPFFFSNGNVDGRMALASRPSSTGKIEIEAADDFTTTTQTQLTSATFTGLLTSGAAAPAVGAVNVEIYRVFPKDSTSPPSGNVPTRVNSPSDVAFDSRGSVAASLSFSTTTLASNFTAGNSVLNGINKIPSQTTGGEGPVTGAEVQFTVTFATPFDLPADHYFFIPQVTVSGGEFYWLSSVRPIVSPGTLFAPDLQSWIRNATLDPDWLRAGTDIVGGTTPPTTFNQAFTLNGVTVPEPGVLTMLLTGLLGLSGARLARRTR